MLTCGRSASEDTSLLSPGQIEMGAHHVMRPCKLSLAWSSKVSGQPAVCTTPEFCPYLEALEHQRQVDAQTRPGNGDLVNAHVHHRLSIAVPIHNAGIALKVLEG